MDPVLRIGVCEDDPGIRKVLVRGLRSAGHDVTAAQDGREAVALLGGVALDAIIMDVGLPDADGRDVVQALQAGGQRAPVLFLTALGTVEDRLSGFAAGADDYLVKPFDLRELLARLQVLARRHDRAPVATGLQLDPLAHAIRHGERQVALTPTEYRMLAAIVTRPGEVVRRAAVVAAGWPDGAIVSENTVDSFLRRLRVKLEQVDAPLTIETVRGVGFTAKERR
ncbi:response regulator transcription factor [Nocardioides sp.]|uniref:response regulator transcription factor n=1 Tax=Nocardioides sp. TaxID=35761 RepID=UPI0035175A20